MWVGDGFSDRFDSNLVGGTKEKRKVLFRLEKCRERETVSVRELRCSLVTRR